VEIFRDAPNSSPDDRNIVMRVIEKRIESSDCLSVFLTRPRGLEFEAGDWLDIRFLSPELAVGRTFSFASGPTESDLRITFRRGRTPFKQRLEFVIPGEILLITQFGSNGFLLDRRYPAVLIAGGIGIAPFRSMVKDVLDHGDNVPITLIHVDRSHDAPFREEFLRWHDDHPDLAVRHLDSAAKGRLTAERLHGLVGIPGRANTAYYVAGPPGFVTATAGLLSRIGVDPSLVKTDSFDGY
jgi:ferredoxin-NADP reductase